MTLPKRYRLKSLNSSDRRQQREVVLLLFAIISVLALSTLGYMVIEGWNFIDSFYMTVTTLATVGFGEVHPLSHPGKIFTIFIIIIGVGVATVVLTTLTNIIIKRQLTKVFGQRRMIETIQKLNGHTIFCGYGRLARVAAKELMSAASPLVIVDRDEARLEEASNAGFLTVFGDATQDEALLRAGVKRAKQLVSLLPQDSDNVYVILTSRELNPELFIMSRTEDESGEKRMLRAGANKVIAPYRVGGQKIANGLLRPYVTDFMDLAAPGSSSELLIEEINIPSLSPIAGKTLHDSALRQKTNIIVAGIISKSGEMQFNPAGGEVLEAGSTLIGIGLKKDFDELAKLLLA